MSKSRAVLFVSLATAVAWACCARQSRAAPLVADEAPSTPAPPPPAAPPPYVPPPPPIAPPPLGAPPFPPPSAPGDAPRRYEFVPVPNIGGNSDVGAEVGVALTFARFYDNLRPYKWRFDAVVTASFKDDQQGLRFVQQYHVLRFDMPNLFSGRVRIDTRASFTRNIEGHWYGGGNDSVAGPNGLPVSPDPTQQDEYLQEEVRLKTLVRVKTGTPLDFATGANLRAEFPGIYAGSKLANDISTAGVLGGQSTLLSTLSAGVILDTRDNEFVPHHGIYYQVGVAGTVGTAENVLYGEASAVLSHYLPIAGPVMFAHRLVTSFQFGQVPFYDLQQGGVFGPQYLLGSDRGVRGIPAGQYAGKIKVISNFELRTTAVPRFRVLKWRVQIGTTTFFDVGRTWDDYSVNARLDGNPPGFKFGVGGGLFFQWDKASVFRVECAYSPVSAGSWGLPVGIYFANGLIF